MDKICSESTPNLLRICSKSATEGEAQHLLAQAEL